MNRRRALLMAGILVLVSGWGTTQYAEARQQGLSDRSRDRAWKGEGEYVSGAVIYFLGISLIAVGSILVVFYKD